MPLSLPNLDDLGWGDLLKEGRTLIPAWAPEWTNHNPSDPGITLVELFAYFSEKLLYRLNRISDKNVEEFLRLINGPEWESEGPKFLAGEKRSSVKSLRTLRRAVTSRDFEVFACAVQGVARAKCIAGRNLESAERGSRTEGAPGHVSLVILSTVGSVPKPGLLATVKNELEPKRLLTTRVHAVPPRYLGVNVRLTIVPRRGTNGEAVRDAAIAKLKRFFDPLAGGLDQKGWEFGGNVYLSDVGRVLGEVEGIESVIPSRDSSGKFLDGLNVAPDATDRLRRNNRGEVEAVLLWPDELVETRIDRADISLPPHA